MAKILVIDDDPQVRHLLVLALNNAGHEAVSAENGAEGVRVYRVEPTDLVITDLIMPEKEGIETIVELRREFPGVRIIAISGGGRQSGVDFLPVAAKLGAVRTLHKPFTIKELYETVAEVLGKGVS